MKTKKQITPIHSNLSLFGSIALFVVAVSVLGVGAFNDRAHNKELDRQGNEIRESNQHIYELILKSSGKAGQSCAVEVDERGKVIYLNELAQETFDLKVGDSVDKVIPEAFRNEHRDLMMDAIEQSRDGGKILSKFRCQAVTLNGLTDAEVETWSTPMGAMAFITVSSN